MAPSPHAPGSWLICAHSFLIWLVANPCVWVVPQRSLRLVLHLIQAAGRWSSTTIYKKMFFYLRHQSLADHHHYPLPLQIPMFPRTAMGYLKHTFPSTPSLLLTNYETTYISSPPSTPSFLWTHSHLCPVSNTKFSRMALSSHWGHCFLH